jgi:hypothetical protein
VNSTSNLQIQIESEQIFLRHPHILSLRVKIGWMVNFNTSVFA